MNLDLADTPTMPRVRAYDRFCAALVPARWGASRQWWRRARGGRWSRNTAGRWREVKACPGLVQYTVIACANIDPPAGVCWDDDNGNSACHCECWP